MTSTSQSGTSTITVNLRQNYDTSKAAAEINIKVNSVLNQLPTGSQQPTITVKVGQTTDAMYLGFRSDTLAPQPDHRLLDAGGAAQAAGGRGRANRGDHRRQNFSLRAWLDPKKLAAYGLTASDVYAALAANDYISAVGNTKGQMVQVTLTSTTNLHSLGEFRNLVVKQVNGSNIRLERCRRRSTWAPTATKRRCAFDGSNGVFVGIQIAPSANLLTVIKGVRAAFPEIQSQLPQGLDLAVVYDSTDFVNSSIHEVAITLIEALVIVMLVIFAFLGSPRSVLIPVVAIPLSLIGTLAIMLALGFSINLLTLLALVLAIGLVVDDAIIVVENVNRHSGGRHAADRRGPAGGARTGRSHRRHDRGLLAVFVPIGFQGGLTGALFIEFAFTLAAAVTVSAVIALTLSPMMCSRLLKPHRADDTTGKPASSNSSTRASRGCAHWYQRAWNAACATRRSPRCSW